MVRRSYYIINGITVYRILAAPFLIFLIFTGQVDLFKWLLAFSFFTDFIDGYLARRYKVISVLGARLDSVADDLTIAAAIVGLIVLKRGFIKEEIVTVIVLTALYIIQNIYALIKYHKTSSFHTYSAKAAAILQGLFLIFMFLIAHPVYMMFYCAAIVTAIDLIEETILIFVLPKWETNVKGLYWVIKRKQKN